jgi:hypothetical protein
MELRAPADGFLAIDERGESYYAWAIQPEDCVYRDSYPAKPLPPPEGAVVLSAIAERRCWADYDDSGTSEESEFVRYDINVDVFFVPFTPTALPPYTGSQEQDDALEHTWHGKNGYMLSPEPDPGFDTTRSRMLEELDEPGYETAQAWMEHMLDLRCHANPLRIEVTVPAIQAGETGEHYEKCVRMLGLRVTRTELHRAVPSAAYSNTGRGARPGAARSSRP